MDLKGRRKIRNVLEQLVGEKTGEIEQTLSQFRPFFNYKFPFVEKDSIISKIDKIEGFCELTVTFRDDILVKHEEHFHEVRDALEQYIRTRLRHLYSHIEADITSLRIILISEFSAAGRLHFHGIAKCKSPEILGQLRLSLSKRFGRCSLACCKYEESYKNYILKNYTDRYDDEKIEYHKSPWGYHSAIYIEGNTIHVPEHQVVKVDLSKIKKYDAPQTVDVNDIKLTF